ncbi:polyprenyl diphosphate synthase [Rubrivirga sp. S365]|uniref:Isoprenyl transferase n=1 Tax=Rubrivirga litoralis TaxID=3075598 RepID=A0ABU3BQT7_9BACT|nr:MULTISPECIES: polyprenyl diphosphate synthase [unclassified Rubrivirga]MDT0631651.1 polyprenyl diphosphate synthase [Rubrivirga sp. F394]MDT7855606.1 polyprenyl diphosphate synthase [Rubrivirga sp. S365]
MPAHFETQSTATPPGLHVACVMDGNGRWAERRGRPRAAGHRAGAEALRRVVEAAPGLGVGVLTVYAFSSDNWRRPAPEVSSLMALLSAHLRAEAPRLKRAGVRLQLVGRRDRLPGALRAAACRAEWETRAGRRLLLRVAVDYSAREAICRAAHALAAPPGAEGGAVAKAEGGAVPDAGRRFEAALAAALHPDGAPAPPVDLLVRTGGERRLSDFLLWESAYAELLFLDALWPDVTAATLRAALADFAGRDRRFGGLAA